MDLVICAEITNPRNKHKSLSMYPTKRYLFECVFGLIKHNWSILHSCAAGFRDLFAFRG